MPDSKVMEEVAYKDDDVIAADDDFFDWCLDIEREALEERGDEEALALNARDRAALHEPVGGDQG